MATKSAGDNTSGSAEEGAKYLITWGEWPQPKKAFSQPAIMEYYSKGKPKLEGDSVLFVEWETGNTKSFHGKNFTIRKMSD